jgi:hypothetical protein
MWTKKFILVKSGCYTNDTLLHSGEKTPNGDWISKKGMVGYIDLVGGNCCYEFHSGPIFSGQLDRSLGAQNHSVTLPQPIHAKNYIYALGVYDDEVREKVYPPYGNTNCQSYMLSLHFTSR